MALKILTIVGARPQFVKAAVLSRQFAQYPDKINEIIVHTGQHFDVNMSDIFFQEMNIPQPDYHLEINSLSHGAMTGRMIEEIEKVIIKEKPDWVLVYGDTNSTLAGALAAVKLHVKVAHVEAGLRSFNMKMPEEINRILTDRISNALFCPTDTAIQNLKKEGFEHFSTEIIKSGDVMQDAAMYYAGKLNERQLSLPPLPDQFILCTLHRAENTDDPERLKNLVEALNHIHQNDYPVVIPLHPRTRNKISQSGLVLKTMVLEPVGYFEMLFLLKHCTLVMTDSGGLQKEAFFFSKNCVTLRDQTEWIELIDGGYNILAGADKQKIISAVNLMLSKDNNFDVDLYGKGKAGQLIANYFLKQCG